MKTKELLDWLINPFKRIAGCNAFIPGIIIVCLTVVIGYYNNVHFPGALDVKLSIGKSLELAFLVQGIGLASLIVVMYMAALIFARGTRFQDILGTITLSRYPLLLIAIAGVMVSENSIINIAGIILKYQSFVISENIGLILCTILMIPIVIWQLVLMYNAFSVSTGMKGSKCIVIYAGSLIIAEIISIAAIYLFV